MKKKELFRRYLVFTVALFVSALGVSVITHSYLGTSPISSIPYVLSLNTPLSMGTYIFILNMILIAGQMLMLGMSGTACRNNRSFCFPTCTDNYCHLTRIWKRRSSYR